MTKFTRCLLGAALAAALATPALAQQSGGTKVGLLTCKTSASLGLIIGSHQRIRCSFAPDNGPPENYEGHINRLGLDLGVKGGGIMTWAVFAPVNGYHHGALAGTYIGGSGSASLGVGVGANALLGGSHRSIALQPLSIEGNVGVNLALGVAGLTLRGVR
ncbi:MAG TPA: DUF992 domain-containing protein [Xanthobacteraceae bacterium]|jgi:hypothetical protein|nr:DUF992 domain-containing protein [Xanthobacteraceae bacterium]